MTADLGFDISAALPWFPHTQEIPYVLVRVSKDHAQLWTEVLAKAARRCYVLDADVTMRAHALGVTEAEIVAAKLPDPGATMAGDFGEILVYLYQSASELPDKAIGPKKWRLKQDRTKASPYSDVVHFVLPKWPIASADDRLLCSEVKVKSTSGAFSPIEKAIKDSAKDRTSRLARTLLWLRDRAIGESLGDVQIGHLNRFINATEYPEAKKKFRAVAVICSSLIKKELAGAPKIISPDFTLVVIEVPDLKRVYSSVFDAAKVWTDEVSQAEDGQS